MVSAQLQGSGCAAATVLLSPAQLLVLVMRLDSLAIMKYKLHTIQIHLLNALSELIVIITELA